jgi:hypothetical protein
LGRVKTYNNRVFKILISRWYWGRSPRATSRIIIFNDKNKYSGNYYVGTTSDLPTKIENNALVFDNKEKNGCDSMIVTRIDLTYGLPNNLFIGCKNKLGDIYSFGAD